MTTPTLYVRPEVYGALSLAVYHDSVARWQPHSGWARERLSRKHRAKAQKLAMRAQRLMK